MESRKNLSNLLSQQLHQPVDFTSQGRISRRIRSQVTPEVFFGAQIYGENEQIGNCGQRLDGRESLARNGLRSDSGLNRRLRAGSTARSASVNDSIRDIALVWAHCGSARDSKGRAPHRQPASPPPTRCSLQNLRSFRCKFLAGFTVRGGGITYPCILYYCG